MLDDIHRVNFHRTFRQEFAELKEVMLTEHRRERLQDMRPLKRWVVFGWWLLKSLLRKLTPARRLLFVLGLFFLPFHVESNNQQYDFLPVGVGIIIFLLMLELKDKLLAHEELEAGHAVQKALMPEQSPQVPGWLLWLFTRSANEVGGDLIDFIRINDNRYGVALGDVAGKGLKAALFSAKLQATLKAIVPDFTSLAALGNKLNHIYSRDGLKSLFASLSYIEFQPDSEVVRILNAGHIPALVVRNRNIESLPKGGPGLGIMAHAEFEEQKVEVRKDELLIVYSDGLTEAQNSYGEFFGEERLRALLTGMSPVSVDELGARLIAEVDRFIGDQKAADDLSIIILKRSK